MCLLFFVFFIEFQFFIFVILSCWLRKNYPTISRTCNLLDVPDFWWPRPCFRGPCLHTVHITYILCYPKSDKSYGLLPCTTKLPGTTPKAGIQIHVYYVMLHYTWRINHQWVVLKYWLLLQVVFTLWISSCKN